MSGQRPLLSKRPAAIEVDAANLNAELRTPAKIIKTEIVEKSKEEFKKFQTCSCTTGSKLRFPCSPRNKSWGCDSWTLIGEAVLEPGWIAKPKPKPKLNVWSDNLINNTFKGVVRNLSEMA